MEPSVARQIVTQYLIGCDVSAQEIHRAWLTIQHDQQYLQALREELCLSPCADSCELFIANMAEFSWMNSMQRRQEFPELVDHLATCRVCLELLWDVAPDWEELSDSSPGSAQAPVRSLALTEPIRMRIDQNGESSQTGIGPPAVRPKYVARAAAAADPRRADLTPEAELEWLLTESHLPGRIRLTIRPSAPDGISLTCGLELIEPTEMDLRDVQLEICDPKTRECYFSGGLEHGAVRNVLLPRRDWTLYVEIPVEREVLRLVVPLLIEHREPGAKAEIQEG